MKAVLLTAECSLRETAEKEGLQERASINNENSNHIQKGGTVSGLLIAKSRRIEGEKF
jgi:hypothetical protein